MKMQCPNCGKNYDFAPGKCGTNFTCDDCMKRFVICDRDGDIAAEKMQKRKKKRKSAILALCITLAMLVLAGGGGFLLWKKLAVMSPPSTVKPDKMDVKAGRLIALIEAKDSIALAQGLRSFDPEWRNEIGETLLFYGVRSGDEQIVRLMLVCGFNINVRNKNGETVLFAAMKKSDLKMFRFLISKGAATDVTSHNDSLWGCAAEMGNSEMLQYMFLQECRFFDNLPGRDPVIFRALRNGHDACVRILLNHSDLKNISDLNGNSFGMACIQKMQGTWARMAIDADNVNKRNKEGKTALFYCCMQEDVVMMDFLLNLQAQVNSDKITTSPLWASINRGNSYSVSQLLRHDIDFSLNDDDGNNYLMIAAKIGNVNVFNAIYRAHRFDLLKKNRQGNTVYRIAVEAGQLEIAEGIKHEYFTALQPVIITQADNILKSHETLEKQRSSMEALLKECEGSAELTAMIERNIKNLNDLIAKAAAEKAAAEKAAAEKAAAEKAAAEKSDDKKTVDENTEKKDVF